MLLALVVEGAASADRHQVQDQADDSQNRADRGEHGDPADQSTISRMTPRMTIVDSVLRRHLSTQAVEVPDSARVIRRSPRVATVRSDDVVAAAPRQEIRPAVITDLVGVVEQEVAAEKGSSGGRPQGRVRRSSSRVVPNLTRRALNSSFPTCSARSPLLGGLRVLERHGLRPPPGRARPRGLGGAARGHRRQGAASGREAVEKKVYRALRGKADGHVQTALPRVAQRCSATPGRPDRRGPRPRTRNSPDVRGYLRRRL